MRRQPLEKVEPSAEAGDEDRRSEGQTGFGNQYFSDAKTVSPAEAIEGVVKRIDLFGSDPVARLESKRTEKTGARVQLVR